MPGWLKVLITAALVTCAATVVYRTTIRHKLTDFGTYRMVAARARAGQPLYQIVDGHYQFKYLPAFGIAAIPLTAMDLETSKALWFGISVFLLTAYVWSAARMLPEPRRRTQVVIACTVLVMAKFYGHELNLGQTNVLLGVLLLAALAAARAGRAGVAGALIALATFVKPYALVLLPWLALSYGASAALVCLVCLAAGLVLPAAIYGWSGNLALLSGWARTVIETTAPNLPDNDNISFAAMWVKWLGPGRAASMLGVASTAAALALAAFVYRRRRRVAAPEYLEVALLMLFVPLISPQGWDYVLLLATPAVVCVVDRWVDLDRGWRIATVAALAVMGLTLYDVMGRTLYLRFMALSFVSVAAIGLAMALAHLRSKALA